ncbi:hypothetical protein HPB47_007217 [Ixodes persulcatus]|uniref:Uncharacterized protein n=1 Tax=Ixodes persulcatus TaxID=34615 RepID=A0AC60P886_IXOPE|nr:hypothetical protein HPB47_007217 [Ixodes persulcatus]
MGGPAFIRNREKQKGHLLPRRSTRLFRSPSSVSGSGRSPWQHDGPAEVARLRRHGSCWDTSGRLEPYGQILEITHGVYKDNPSVKTGIRYLKMKMKEDNPVPNFARIAGYRVIVDYRGLVRVCRRCKKEGHFKTQCTAEYCSRCAIFGHDGSTCTESCRRCGAGHATVDCTSRRSYASVTQQTMMDFPPLATRPSSSSMRQEGHEGDSSGAPMQPPPEKATSAATSESEPDQSPTQAATPSRATLEGL